MTKDKPRSYTVNEPAQLLPFLLQSLSHLSRNAVKSILTRGQVSVDGRKVTAHNYELQPGQNVTISSKASAQETPFIGLTIVHEDQDIIVVLKESGLLTIAAPNEPEMTAYRQLTAYVRRSNPKHRIFIVHRLDRDTSGLLVFAKSEKVQQQMQTTWQDSVKERIYYAVVEGVVKKPEGTITSWLKESKTLIMYSSRKPNDGQHAVTHYKVLATTKTNSLLEVQLETGRKNQIRVHLQDIGHPVVGDKKYGARSNPIGRLGLHAGVLAFTHPVTGHPMRFNAELPKAFKRLFPN